MATLFGAFGKLCEDLRDMVWRSALLTPGVHFLKPNGNYNGTFRFPAGENRQFVNGPGVSEVSSMSAACEHARLSRTSSEGKGELITISTYLDGSVSPIFVCLPHQQLQSHSCALP